MTKSTFKASFALKNGLVLETNATFEKKEEIEEMRKRMRAIGDMITSGCNGFVSFIDICVKVSEISAFRLYEEEETEE